MIGLLYLLLCFAVGNVICTAAFPKLRQFTRLDYEGNQINLSPYLLLFPAWFVIGTLILSWSTYFLGYLFGNYREPLLYANLIVIPIACIAFAINLFLRSRKNRKLEGLLCKDKRTVYFELVLLVLITLLASILMWQTFFQQGDQLHIGITVFGDFSPHIAMIRSFSYGNNFPTAYSHYAGEDIKYHFMYQFFVGNLEYLGLRIDFAFNLPSIISFVSAFLLLYILAMKITGKRIVGALACLFFAFRSSKTLFTYIASLPAGTNVLKALRDNMEFISDTPNEEWGLWNLNVYCNQRHLALGLAVMFLVILLMMPRLYAMFGRLKDNGNESVTVTLKGDRFIGHTVYTKFKVLFLTVEGWKISDFKEAIAIGVLLGSLGFFHGSVVIGCLCILFVLAILSERRLEYLIVAVITILFTVVQSRLFIQGSAVTPNLFFGFIAENKTIFGVASYLERLLGILPLVLLAAFSIEKAIRKYILVAFSMPLLFAFTVSLTIDVTVNHKYIMMSCIMLGIFAASFVTTLLQKGKISFSVLGILLILMLTATGIYDFTMVIKRNTTEASIILNTNNNLTNWVKENSDSKDIFLSSDYSINQLVFGGAMLYEGWAYFPWSAGYDTGKRYSEVAKMYEASTPEELDQLCKENKIRYIIVDRDNRESELYTVNEQNISSTYQWVYKEGEGEYLTTIYDTLIPIY
ncbi:MAG: hypothetical protein QM644_03935 [Mobilitalea sp.]